MGAEAGAEGYGLFINIIVMAPLALFALVVMTILIQILFICKKLDLRKQLLYCSILLLTSQALKLLFTGKLTIQFIDYVFGIAVILAILLLPLTKWLTKPK